MRDYDKFLSDLDAWAGRSSRREPSPRDMDELRRLYRRILDQMPESVAVDFFEAFSARYSGGDAARRSGALAWLGATAGILRGEYDGSPLSRDEWADIGETVSANADELDVELLTQIMSLVLENGGL